MPINWSQFVGSVGYDELPPSPTFSGGRDSPNAQRIFMIDWSNVDTFLASFFPAAIRTGRTWIFPVSVSFPGRSYLTASAYRVDPFDPENTLGFDGNGVRMYEYAKVTIDYKTSEYDNSPMGDDPAQQGSQILADYSSAYSAEMLKMGISGWYWEGDFDSPIKNEDCSIAMLVSQIEHTLTWKYVPLPPFRTIAKTVGCVNTDERLFFAPAGTLLLTGAELKRSFYSQDDQQSWTVVYKFLQRIVNTSDPDEVIGWNQVWRNETGSWSTPQAFTGDVFIDADRDDPDNYENLYAAKSFGDLFLADDSEDS